MSRAGFRRAGLRAYWLLRWFAWEFLAISLRGDLSALWVGISRVVAWLAICGVLHVALSGGVADDPLAAAIQWTASAALALALGNLARECTVSVASQVMVSLGREFRREGRDVRWAYVYGDLSHGRDVDALCCWARQYCV